MCAPASVRAGRREHPRRAGEQVDVRAVEPVLLGPGHRVATDEPGREVGPGLLAPRARTEAFTEPTSVTTGGARVERLDHHVGHAPDRGRHDHDVRAGDRVGASSAPPRSRHPTRDAPRGLVRIGVEPRRTSTPGTRQRETDRPTDQAGADERDAAARATPGGRRAGSSRPRGTRGAARRGRAPCSRCIRTRTVSGIPPSMPSSRAQISGTSPRPSARAAVAGNSAVRSSVAVKMMLTMSSCSMPLRSSIAWTRACVFAVDLLQGVLVAGDRAAQRPAVSSPGGTYLEASGPRRHSALSPLRRPGGGVQPPHLVRLQRPATPPAPARGRRAAPIRVRTSRRTGWPTASHMRRTCRLRPSWITSSIAAWSPRDCTSRTSAGAVTPSSSSTPSRSGPQRGPARNAVDLGQVLLLDPVARVREQLREVAVVREHEQPLGLAVEAADREHARLGRHQVDHRRAALRVRRGADGAHRLVQQVVDEPRAGDDRDTVELDAVSARGRRAGRGPRPHRRP